MKKNVLLLALFAMLLTSCDIHLSTTKTRTEPTVTVTRAVDDFVRINLLGSTSVYYTQGDSLTVNVDAPANLIDYVVTEVVDSCLTVRMSDDARSILTQIAQSALRDVDDIKVYVTSPDLVEVSLLGSGDFKCDSHLDTDNLRLTLRGSGEMHFADIICDHLVTSAVGSGDIDIDKVVAQTSSVELVGSGDVKVNHENVERTDIMLKGSGDVDASFVNCGAVSGDLRGSGDIKLLGNVHAMNKKTLGSGDFDTSGLIIAP